jgi:hypothetical protein
MTKIQASWRAPSIAGREFSKHLYRIRDVHIDLEYILQSLAELQNDNPCSICTNVCCKEEICRESIDSDFLRFILGPLVNSYSGSLGWYVPGLGCRLNYGRPLVCYEYYCGNFEIRNWTQLKQLSHAFKIVYSNAFAGRHILAVEDITRISANKLITIHGRLVTLREVANQVLQRSVRSLWLLTTIPSRC